MPAPRTDPAADEAAYDTYLREQMRLHNEQLDSEEEERYADELPSRADLDPYPDDDEGYVPFEADEPETVQ